MLKSDRELDQQSPEDAEIRKKGRCLGGTEARETRCVLIIISRVDDHLTASSSYQTAGTCNESDDWSRAKIEARKPYLKHRSPLIPPLSKGHLHC